MARNSTLGLAALAALLVTGSAQAQTIGAAKATLVAATAATPAAAESSNAIVTQIIGTPTTTETFLIQDGTGAIEVFRASTTSYTPAVGDTVSVSGAITSFHGLFEFETAGTNTMTVTKTGTASQPAPLAFTVAGLQNGSTVGFAQQSELGTLSNVTFNGSNAVGTFASGGTYTVTDGSGLSATIYIASTDTAIIGTTIPTGPVSVNGYLGQFGANSAAGSTLTTFGAGAVSNDGYELVPLTFAPAATPEPGSVTGIVIGVGLLGLAATRRRYSVK